MSSQSPEPTFRLSVRAGHPATEIVVLDHQLTLVARGVGSLVVDEPAGVYKVKARLARAEREIIIALEGDRDVVVDLRPSSSPVPISQTDAPVLHWAVARDQSRQTHAQLGEGASLFFMWREASAGPGDAPWPMEGAALCDVEGRALMALDSSKFPRGEASDVTRWSAATVGVRPGAFILRQRNPCGDDVEQAVIAVDGWQTQLFRVREYGRPGEGSSGGSHAQTRDTVSLLMGRGGFDPESDEVRLADIMRVALTDDRSVVSSELRDAFVHKLQNPLLGIMAAHVLDGTFERRQTEQGSVPAPSLDRESFDQIITMLRTLVGDDHPDVEALSLSCSDSRLRTTRSLRTPPMFRRSWSLYVRASNDAPELVPVSVWQRIALLTAVRPYLCWRRPPVAPKSRWVPDILQAYSTPQAGSVVESRLQEIFSQGASGVAARVPVIRQFAKQFDDPKAAEAFSRRLSLTFDVPRAVIDQVYKRWW